MKTAIDGILATLLRSGAKQATKFVSAKEVIRLTRITYGKRKFDPRRLEVRIQHGPPNYAEREFIQSCKRAGERFPVRKVQLKFPK